MRISADAVHERARAPWPDIAIDAAAFARFVAERLAPDDEVGRLHLSDLYLVCGCLAGDSRAIAAFEASYLGPVGAHVLRIDPSPAFLDEVRQRLRERLLVGGDGAPPRLRSYSGRGALGSWLHVAAVRTAFNVLRDERGERRCDDFADASLVAASVELRLLQERFRADFRVAFAAAIGALGADERQLLRLHFVDGLSLGQMGRLYGYGKSTLSRRIAAAREHLYGETERLLRARLRIDHDELASLLRVVRSGLGDLSLARLLRVG
jgi:RNA polymerase sigma-70 factor (ECF subfamily)